MDPRQVRKRPCAAGPSSNVVTTAPSHPRSIPALRLALAAIVVLAALLAALTVACSDESTDATGAESPTAAPVDGDPSPVAAETPADSGQAAGDVAVEGDDETASVEENEGPAVDVLFDYLQAVGLLNAGMYKEAVGRYNVVLRIHPDLYLAYRGRALAYYNEDLFDLALEDFDRAIEIKPDYAEALRDRGVMMANQGRHREARRDLERAVEIYREKGDLVGMSEALTQLQRLPGG